MRYVKTPLVINLIRTARLGSLFQFYWFLWSIFLKGVKYSFEKSSDVLNRYLPVVERFDFNLLSLPSLSLSFSFPVLDSALIIFGAVAFKCHSPQFRLTFFLFRNHRISGFSAPNNIFVLRQWHIRTKVSIFITNHPNYNVTKKWSNETVRI